MYVQGVGLGVIDHVPAQNQAGADLTAVVAEWQNAKNAGTLYQQVAQNFATRLKYIGDTFATFARSLHNARADAGAAQIQDLANRLAANVMADVQPMPAGAISMPPQQTVIDAPITFTGQPETGIMPAIQRTVQTIVHDVTGGAQDILGTVDAKYGPQPAPFDFSSLLMPAAAVAAVYLLTRK